MSLATATLHGNLGKAAELKTLQSGTQVCSFSVAVSEKRNGNETTTWWDCSLFGERAAKLAPHLIKGSSVVVVGKPGVRAYSKDGAAVGVATLMVNELSFASSKPKDGSSQQEKDPWD